MTSPSTQGSLFAYPALRTWCKDCVLAKCGERLAGSMVPLVIILIKHLPVPGALSALGEQSLHQVPSAGYANREPCVDGDAIWIRIGRRTRNANSGKGALTTPEQTLFSPCVQFPTFSHCSPLGPC
eukprot:1178207-Prorocentrum_minimum.AAC.2